MNSRDRIQKLYRDLRDGASELFLFTTQPTINHADLANYIDGLMDMLSDQGNEIHNSMADEALPKGEA